MPWADKGGGIGGEKTIKYFFSNLCFTTSSPLLHSAFLIHLPSIKMNDQEAFAIAIEEAKLSHKEGGVPIGAALVSRDGKLLGRFVFLDAIVLSLS